MKFFALAFVHFHTMWLRVMHIVLLSCFVEQQKFFTGWPRPQMFSTHLTVNRGLNYESDWDWDFCGRCCLPLRFACHIRGLLSPLLPILRHWILLQKVHCGMINTAPQTEASRNHVHTKWSETRRTIFVYLLGVRDFFSFFDFFLSSPSPSMCISTCKKEGHICKSVAWCDSEGGKLPQSQFLNCDSERGTHWNESGLDSTRSTPFSAASCVAFSSSFNLSNFRFLSAFSFSKSFLSRSNSLSLFSSSAASVLGLEFDLPAADLPFLALLLFGVPFLEVVWPPEKGKESFLSLSFFAHKLHGTKDSLCEFRFQSSHRRICAEMCFAGFCGFALLFVVNFFWNLSESGFTRGWQVFVGKRQSQFNLPEWCSFLSSLSSSKSSSMVMMSSTFKSPSEDKNRSGRSSGVMAMLLEHKDNLRQFQNRHLRLFSSSFHNFPQPHFSPLHLNTLFLACLQHNTCWCCIEWDLLESCDSGLVMDNHGFSHAHPRGFEQHLRWHSLGDYVLE